MREQARFNRVVFGSIGGIGGKANLDPDFIGELLEVFLEDMRASIVASTAIAQEQNGSGVGIEGTAIGIPPFS
jgi:phage shock protein PspC (stress-responsive transcriptional regulator)